MVNKFIFERLIFRLNVNSNGREGRSDVSASLGFSDLRDINCAKLKNLLCNANLSNCFITGFVDGSTKSNDKSCNKLIKSCSDNFF